MAAEWRIEPHLAASETYTDNVNLTSADQKKSDFITEITPGVSINASQGRSQGRFDYSPQVLIYAHDSNLNRVNHLLSADGKTELARNWLFLDGAANLSRQNVSLLGPIGLGNNAVGTQNLTSVRTYRVSPYILNRLGPYANYEIRYQRDGVSAGNDLLSNSQADKYTVNMTSSTAASRYKWGVKLYKENVHYTNAPDQGNEYANLDFSYFLTSHFALTATDGYEKYTYFSTGEKPQGNYWNAGIAWQPSSLTSLNLSRGEHYYGRTYALDFLHRSRTFLWKASYNESVSTTRSNLLVPQTLDAQVSASISDPVQRAEVINKLNSVLAPYGLSTTTIIGAVNFLTNQTFLDKRADASVAWYSGKTTVVFSAFRDVRDTTSIGSQTSVLFGVTDFNNSNNIRQQGANILFDWAFAAKISIDLNTGYNDTKFRDTNTNQKLKYIRTGVRHKLTTKATGAIDLRHNQNDTNGTGSTYRENAISVSVNLRF